MEGGVCQWKCVFLKVLYVGFTWYCSPNTKYWRVFFHTAPILRLEAHAGCQTNDTNRNESTWRWFKWNFKQKIKYVNLGCFLNMLNICVLVVKYLHTAPLSFDLWKLINQPEHNFAQIKLTFGKCENIVYINSCMKIVFFTSQHFYTVWINTLLSCIIKNIRLVQKGMTSLNIQIGNHFLKMAVCLVHSNRPVPLLATRWATFNSNSLLDHLSWFYFKSNTSLNLNRLGCDLYHIEFHSASYKWTTWI